MTEKGGGTNQPPIADYAIIGDCRTAALVSRGGSIDWCCLPRFDSPSVFGALLDTERGGCFRVRPAGPFTVDRRYLPGTNVLETTFRTDRGVLRLTDAMTVPDPDVDRLFPDHEILRRVECLEGEVEVEVLCDPRFDYGRRVDPGRERGELGIFFDGAQTGLVLRSDLPLAPRDGVPGWHGGGRLRAGERRHLSLTAEHAAPVVLCRLGDDAERRLEHTGAWWRTWLRQCAYRGEYQELVFRSMLTLKLLMYPPSGAILAAATTSLPETLGGERNWDYRYCWLRDAAMTIDVLLQLGFAAEGEAFLEWLLHATRLTRPRLQVLYDVHGRTDQTSGQLDHLAGYRGSRPVRIGNGAISQLQLDLYGEVLRSAWSFVRHGGDLDHADATFLADLGRAVCEDWEQPDHGIWEVPGERRHYTHSRAMCWVGLRCLLSLDQDGHLSLGRDRAEIEDVMARLRSRTDARGWSGEIGSYVAWYGGDRVDAALLLLGTLGYDEPDSDRMLATQRAVRSRLDDRGLLRRYAYDDTLAGREGAFGACAFWEVELLARQRRVEEAQERFEFAASFANDVGLFSEQFDAETGELLGNFPQTYTHIGLVSAANEIARAREPAPEAAAREARATAAETGA